MNSKLDLDGLRESYDRDGFVIIRGLYSEEELGGLRAELDRYVRDVVPQLPKDQAFFDDYAKPETLRKMQSLHKHDPWFDTFLRTGPHLALLEYLLGEKVRPQAIEWFDK